MEPINKLTESIADRIKRDFIPPEKPAKQAPAAARSAGFGDPDCPICHGIGFVRDDSLQPGDPGFGKIVPCECHKKDIMEAERKARAEISNLNGYEQMTFATFNTEGRGQLRDDQKANLQYAKAIAMKYAENPDGWLFFTGTYGTGKTHLAAAIANEALEHGVANIFQPVPDLLDQLRSSFGKTGESYQDRFDRVRTIPLLILDDLGTQNDTGWAEEKLYQIINYRYVNKLPTVVTTNVPLREMDGRIASRLKDPMVNRVTFMTPDYRDPLSGSGGEDDLSILHLLGDRNFKNFSTREKENLSPEASAQLAKALAESVEFAADPRGWLVLAGPSGIGKTHLAAAIGNQCRDRMENPIFVTASDLLDHLRATFNPNSSTGYDKVFEQVRGAQVLILNYLDTVNATSWSKEKMYQILNYRYQAKLPTVITLMKPIKEVDPNIRSRLVDATVCTVVQMFDVPMYNKNPDVDLSALKGTRRYKKA